MNQMQTQAAPCPYKSLDPETGTMCVVGFDQFRLEWVYRIDGRNERPVPKDILARTEHLGSRRGASMSMEILRMHLRELYEQRYAKPDPEEDTLP